ncbi:MAG TPA: carboxymuconolactone decarboxylase family protein [Fibrobacteria bacterium]|nr:carboxymuconolactone decarboxylase family protein [Fibrobacteria bacterium]HOX49907.1 carboxymuconolactone decarboxylase family protein [Fibrobacteria bacterium]
MTSTPTSVSDSFQVFLRETPAHAHAWMTAAQALGQASALDAKTAHLSYLAVLAALGLESGVPFHANLARDAGATREEVASAVLVGLSAAGNVVIRSLPPALSVFEG